MVPLVVIDRQCPAEPIGPGANNRHGAGRSLLAVHTRADVHDLLGDIQHGVVVALAQQGHARAGRLDPGRNREIGGPQFGDPVEDVHVSVGSSVEGQSVANLASGDTGARGHYTVHGHPAGPVVGDRGAGHGVEGPLGDRVGRSVARVARDAGKAQRAAGQNQIGRTAQGVLADRREGPFGNPHGGLRGGDADTVRIVQL